MFQFSLLVLNFYSKAINCGKIGSNFKITCKSMINIPLFLIKRIERNKLSSQHKVKIAFATVFGCTFWLWVKG